MNSYSLFLALILLLSCTGLNFAPPLWAQSESRGASASPAKTKTKPKAKAKSRTASARKKHVVSRRVQRLNRAFIASADLKPMARQLVQNRTRAAYAGVESYARKHAHDDAGSLAYFTLGYAHILDHDYDKAVDPLTRAQAHAGELGDYVTYFLATAYGGAGRSEQVIASLRDFSAKYPESLFLRDAVEIYGNALIAAGRPAEAVAVLEQYRKPQRSDMELTLGRAYSKSGQAGRAGEALRRVYYAMPLSPEAADAGAAFATLVSSGAVAPASFGERKARADLLAQGRRFADAAREYRSLLSEAPADEKPALQVALAVALQHSGSDRQAREMLESLPESTGEGNARRLFALAEMARSSDDEARFSALLGRMRQTASTSPWFEEALLLGGNRYLLRREYDQAIDCYRELQQRFPAGKRASYAHWKAAWLTLRQGRKEEAKREFEEEVSVYPNMPEIPAAMYWRARLAEEDRDPLKARAWYQKLADRFPHYYYADMARVRLRNLPSSGDPPNDDPVLAKIPPTPSAAGFQNVNAPADDIRVQKSMLLQNGGLTDLAIRELRAAADGGGASWANSEVARLYQDNGQYHRALQTLKRAVPAYYSLDINALPRPYWEGLFPRPYWTDLKRYSVSNQLDPFLVASLIRQESEFNPGAISRADALGLMQLLPGTGKKVAHELRLRRYATEQLLSPTTNMELGTRYFRGLVDKFDGRLEYALAAYNAGPDRVTGWLNDGKFHDPQEFVESIPFTETREYVQAILRNASIYRRLYGAP